MAGEPPMFVFAYGSLLSPASLTAAVPDVDLDACVPAWCDGWRRAFTVGFPNDGSQPDKEYRDGAGGRPPLVRFCDLEPAPGRRVNGVCVPVHADTLARLRRRELRYDETTVTGSIRRYSGAARLRGEVVAFFGSRRFRGAVAGVVPEAYLAATVAGAGHWERVAPGFLDDFHRSTRLPDPRDVRPLIRIDRTDPLGNTGGDATMGA